MTQPSSPSVHVEPHDLAAYLEGTLGPAARSRVEAHLADCEECTSELVAVSRLHRPAAPAARWLGLAAAAAAVIAVVMVGRPAGRSSPINAPVVRGDAAPAEAMVQPANDTTLSTPPLFVWRSVPGAAAYRITVSRADGDSVWAASLRDTVARAPESTLVADTYYWYVDAILSDGTSRAGTVRRFRLTP
jgi:anti-sigma factor RsiW